MTADEDSKDLRRAPRTPAADEITLENVRLGKITPEDLTIRRETLIRQAVLAEQEGYPQLGRNFRRAAELTALPNDVLLAAYERLRPYRATYFELLALSQEIAARYDAPETGAYIREAAEALNDKGLLKKDEPN
ncbi:MAG: propanediol utilization protein [Proteobacteria bacterium]|nr:propanediol utilization protein [Pseudomonadota bacterium]